MEKQMPAAPSHSDFTNLPNFRAYVRMLIDGQAAQPFDIETLPACVRPQATAETIRKLSRQKYAVARHAAEKEIGSSLRGGDSEN